MPKLKTIKDRRQAFQELSQKSKVWQTLSEESLLAEVQTRMSAITEGTPLECLRILMLFEAEKLVGD